MDNLLHETCAGDADAQSREKDAQVLSILPRVLRVSTIRVHV